MPLLGRASDRFGRKLVLQVSLAGFAVGSVVTALSDRLCTVLVDRPHHPGRRQRRAAAGDAGAGAPTCGPQRNRAGVLGGIGAAQELGSVLGPLYGIAVVWLLSTLARRVLDQRAAGDHRDGDDPLQPAVAGPAPAAPEKVDVVGGVLLAIALGLAVIGLYNPAPDGKQVLPAMGRRCSSAARRGRDRVLRLGAVRHAPS